MLDSIRSLTTYTRRMVTVRGLAVPAVALAMVGLLTAPGAQARGPANNSIPTAAAATATQSRIALGAYSSGMSGSGTQITQFEQLLGSKVAISSSFRGWGDLFPDATQDADAASGHTLLIAWDLGSTSATRFTTFTSHKHDAYLAQEAAQAKAFGAVVYIRPWAEMNGDWSAFQPTASGSQPAGGRPAQFIAAWRYIVNFFRSHGATNVRWVFNPTTDTYAQTTTVSTIWPGSAYVDVLGLDGYNWGTGGVFRWSSFTSIYTTQYDRLVALSPTLPVWICEIGSKAPNESDGAPPDPNNTKATWYQGLFSDTTMTNISAVVMFNMDKERDWRIQSDPETLALVSAVAKNARATI